MSDASQAPRDLPTSYGRVTTGQMAARLGRLTMKELREILRDRRTIVTLVLMPLLVYPLLSIGFRQVFLSRLLTERQTACRIGFASSNEGNWLQFYLDEYGELDEDPPADEQVTCEFFMVDDLERAVRNGSIDLGVRLKHVPSAGDFSRRNLAVDAEFLLAENYPLGEKTLRIVERRLAAANAAFLQQRLRAINIRQRASPVQTTTRRLEGEASQPPVSLLTVLPLILIMMTITGAVYPAIDLTAGERERGTLEILVAAPVPRLGLLLAKYVSVLTVALLTATVNLVTMALTIALSGMTPLLFGQQGFTLLMPMQVFGLLVLFAAFFSAVLLSLTSFARSFKEAQAYLIPLMLLSLAPGLLSMMPGLKLTGLLAVAPLINIVLLGRELLEQTANFGTAVIVVISTFLYAAAAVAVAARVFGSEDVLFNTQSGWSDVFRRAAEPRPAPTVSSAMFCLALTFPAFFVSINSLARLSDLPLLPRLLLYCLATVVLFGGFPLLAAWLGHDPPKSAFQLRRPGWLAFPAALVLGLSLWPLAHEVVVWELELGLASFGEAQFAQVREMVKQWREVPVAWILLTMAVAPGLCEEFFFRGYLFRALLANTSAKAAVFSSALLFGAFHLVTPTHLAFERFLPSMLLGLVLGWVCLRTGSVLPGMLLHVSHNAFLLAVSYYEPWLTAQGWGIEEASHLPASWLLASAAATAVGISMIWLSSKNKSATTNI